MKQKKPTTMYKADIVNTQIVDWFYDVYKFTESNSAFPDKMQSYQDKLTDELTKWIENTFDEFQIPIVDRHKRLLMNKTNDERPRPEALDFCIIYEPNGIITIDGRCAYRKHRLLGKPYELPEVEEPEVEKSVDTKAATKNVQMQLSDIAKNCNTLINSIGQDRTLMRSSIDDEWFIFNIRTQFMLNKYLHDKIMHDKLDCSLRKLTTLRRNTLKLKESFNKIDEHFTRYDDFEKLMLDSMFNSYEYVAEFANSLSDILLSAINECNDEVGDNTSLRKIALDMRRDMGYENLSFVDRIKYYIYDNMYYYGYDKIDEYWEKSSDRGGFSSIIDGILSRNSLIFSDDEKLIDCDYTHDRKLLSKENICLMYPEMFGAKVTKCNSYSNTTTILTPMEKFAKEFDNLESHFKMLFALLSWENDISTDASRYSHECVSPENKLWTIKVPKANFIESITQICDEPTSTFTEKAIHCYSQKVDLFNFFDHTIDGAVISEALCKFDTAFVKFPDDVYALDDIWTNARNAYRDATLAAINAKHNGETLDMETVKDIISSNINAMFGRAITPKNKDYESTKKSYINAIDAMLERITILEDGLLASDSTDFIEWCMKEQFVDKEHGRARLEELAKESVTEEVAE